MAKRATIKVSDVQTLLQNMIDRSELYSQPRHYLKDADGVERMPTPSEAVRLAMAAVLADVLHETGNYHGFSYRDWDDHGCKDWDAAGRPTGRQSQVPGRHDQGTLLLAAKGASNRPPFDPRLNG